MDCVSVSLFYISVSSPYFAHFVAHFISSHIVQYLDCIFATDCLYPGISSGPIARCRVWEAFTFFTLHYIVVRRGPNHGHRQHVRKISWSLDAWFLRQPNFAALNRGRHLCSAGRPSRWALAQILVVDVFKMAAVRHLICYVCVWTTHEGHLVVFIVVQNLVWIDAVVLIICMFYRFHEFGLKTPIHAPKIVFFRFYPLNGEQCQQNPKKAHPCASPRRLSHHARQSVDASDL